MSRSKIWRIWWLGIRLKSNLCKLVLVTNGLCIILVKEHFFLLHSTVFFPLNAMFYQLFVLCDVEISKYYPKLMSKPNVDTISVKVSFAVLRVSTCILRTVRSRMKRNLVWDIRFTIPRIWFFLVTLCVKLVKVWI